MSACRYWTMVLIAILLLPNIAASADQAKEAYEKGKACLKKRHYEAAVLAFTDSIRLNPEYAEAYCGRGIAYAYGRKPDHEKAITDYTEAIRLDRKMAAAYMYRGAAYRIKRDHDKAVADFSEAIRLAPQDANAYYCRASDVQQQSRIRQGDCRLHRSYSA